MKKPILFIQSISLVFAFFVASVCYAEEKSLYDRIGGEPVVKAIVADIFNNHVNNPVVSNRFANSDPVYVMQRVYEIFAAATGGPVEYTGKDMPTAHKTMNINDTEFNAVVDDVLAALTKHNVSGVEYAEVLAILWSVKDQVVRQ